MQKKKKNEKFQEFCKNLKFNFSAVCLSETFIRFIRFIKKIENGYKITFMDINPFIKPEMVAKEEGSVLFYVTRYLIK